MSLAGVQEAFEKAKRATLNATVRKAAKRKEKALLQEYRPRINDITKKMERCSIKTAPLDSSFMMQ